VGLVKVNIMNKIEKKINIFSGGNNGEGKV
jgi:hypothetical protein